MNKEQGSAGPGSFMHMVTAAAGVGMKAQEEPRHKCKGSQAQESNLPEATAPSPWSIKNDNTSEKQDLFGTENQVWRSIFLSFREQRISPPHPMSGRVAVGDWLDNVDVWMTQVTTKDPHLGLQMETTEF